MNKEQEMKCAMIACAGFLAVCIATWLYFLFNYNINANNALLIEFARRMVEGGKFGLDYIDTNPPYNIFLYAPVVWLSYLGIPIYYGVTIYTFGLLAVSCFLSWKILKNFSFLNLCDCQVFIGAFAIASISMCTIFFGERDQIILFGLLPFVLTQYAFNTNTKLDQKLSIPSLLFGAGLILIKPHYGLVPTLMIGARLYTQRKISSFLKSDFIILSLAVIGYIIMNITLFPTYWSEILPYLRKGYIFIAATDNMFSVRFLILAGITAAMFWASLDQRDKNRKNFQLMLSTLLAGLLIAYYTQYKGFYYHLLPAMIFGFAAVSFMLLPRKNFPGKTIFWLAIGTLFLMSNFPPKPRFPTHSQYVQLPLSAALSECDKPCTFLIDNQAIFGTFETSAYTNAIYGSRFSSFWFETDFACGQNMEFFDQYAAMVAEDFKRMKPQIVILYRDSDACPDGQAPIPFEEVFAKNNDFKNEWALYSKQAPLTFNRRVYFGSTTTDFDYPMEFDIFRRTDRQFAENAR
jgi:hypothetical protein